MSLPDSPAWLTDLTHLVCLACIPAHSSSSSISANMFTHIWWKVTFVFSEMALFTYYHTTHAPSPISIGTLLTQQF